MFIVYMIDGKAFATYSLCSQYARLNNLVGHEAKLVTVIETTDNWFGDLTPEDLTKAIDIELGKKGFKVTNRRLTKELDPYMLIKPWELVANELKARDLMIEIAFPNYAEGFPPLFWPRLFSGEQDLTVEAAIKFEDMLNIPMGFFINAWYIYYKNRHKYREVDGALLIKPEHKAKEAPPVTFPKNSPPKTIGELKRIKKEDPQ